MKTVLWLHGRRPVAEVNLSGSGHGQLAVGVVEAPVHAGVVRALFGLFVDRFPLPQNLILERRLLIRKRLFQFLHVFLIFWVYLPVLHSLRSLLIFDCLCFHSSFLLIEVKLHLIETFELGWED